MAPQKSPTLFDFRLNSARSNLEDLRTFVTSIRERNHHLYHLHTALVQDQSKIAKALGRLTDDVRQADGHIASPNEFGKEDLQDDIKQFDRHLKILSEKIQELRNHAIEISVLQLDATVLGLRNTEFEEKIVKGTAVLDTISKAASKNSLSLAKPTDPAKHWSELRLESRNWVQYLDYLAGLSLRHDGLADQVCFITDGLIWELQGSPKEPSALAIPGRDESAGVLPKVVYLRFPEWTVWALPLAAHELWHIIEPASPIKTGFERRVENALDGDEPIRNTPFWRMRDQEGFENEDSAALSKRLAESAHMRNCLADAFATFTMGPAYACSSILLVVDPLMDTDRYRAKTILRALKRLNDLGKYEAFAAILENLSQLWEQATRDAGVLPEALPQDLTSWIDCLLDYLQGVPGISFPTEEDLPLTALVEKYLRREVFDIDTNELTLRFVLAEAWKARIETPEQTITIAKYCEKLCKAIISNRGTQGSPSLKKFVNMQG